MKIVAASTVRKYLLGLGLAAVSVFIAPVNPPAAQEAGTSTIIYQTAIFPSLGSSDIYSVNADGTNDKALTRDGQSILPSWSSDGRRILFVHDVPVPAPAHPEHTFPSPIELYEMNRDGSNPRLIRRFEQGIDSDALSPDGKTLAVSNGLPHGRLSLFLLPSDGRGEPRLLVRNAIQPAWSPDGKRIAFASEIADAAHFLHYSVDVINVDGSNRVHLVDQAASPAWSPDGQEIAFVNEPGSAPGPALRVGTQQIFITKIADNGLNVRQITEDSQWRFCSHPSWSPDGKKIAFSCHTKGCFVETEWGGGDSLPRVCMSRVFVIPVDDQYPKSVSQLVPLIQLDAAFPVFAPK